MSFTFGAKTTAPPSFGTGTLSFGTPTSQTQQQPAPGFSFGATVPSATSTPGLFGSAFPTTSKMSTVGPQPTSTVSSLFGAAPITSTGLSLNQPTAAPTLSFGTTTSAGGSTFGSGTHTGLTSGSTAPTAQSTVGLTFGLGPTMPYTAPSYGSLFGGSGGSAPVVSSTASSFTPASTGGAAVSVGLGGIATTQAKSAVTTQKETPPKDQPLPNEILRTVEDFKEFVKQQKIYSSEIARCSVREFRKVEQEIDLLNSYISEVEKQLQKNRQLAEKLKHDTAQNVQYVEMAQRTHDTPPGLQYENTAPLKFFLSLADHFEHTMQMLNIQIDSADKYVKDHKNPDSLTPQDLALGMRRLHETFVALAGRLQSVHSQVESQKETYLNMRKLVLNDTSNPFDKTSAIPAVLAKSLVMSPPKVATGPTPFSNFAIGNVNISAQQQNSQPPPPAYPGMSSTGTPGFGTTNFLTTSASAPLFGSSLGQNTAMQLQKPTVGNKRGKID